MSFLLDFFGQRSFLKSSLFLFLALTFSCTPQKKGYQGYYAKPKTVSSNSTEINSLNNVPLPLPAKKSPTKRTRASKSKIVASKKRGEFLKPLIVIDPGHGGKDFGTFSHTKPRVHEKAFNLSTSHYLRKYLKEKGFETLMTREADETVELIERASFANEKKPVLFVSVHYNSAPNKKAEGVEVFFYDDKEDPKRKKNSKELAEAVFKQVIALTDAKPRAVKTGNFLVIRETKMPAILVEGGFLSNEGELRKIQEVVYQKKIALGIAKGIEEYYLSLKK